MIYGYAKVATDCQDLAGQLGDLRAVGRTRIFCEKLTGITAERLRLK